MNTEAREDSTTGVVLALVSRQAQSFVCLKGVQPRLFVLCATN